MAARQQKEAAGLPGFFNVNHGGHGYAGRHFYSPTTGEALSIRQGQDIRAGKYTIEQALLRNQTPLGTHMVQKHNTVTKVTVFRHMSGAYFYATQSSHSCYFVVYGEVKEPYEEDDGKVKSYRTISRLASARSIKAKGIQHYWKQASEQIVIDGRARYIVMEKID